MLPQGCVANLLDRELSGVARLGRILSWTISFAADERRRDEERWGAKTTDDANQLWMESDRYRESFDEPSPIEPGEVYEYTIRLNPTSNLFQRGHQIRVDVSSSDFPNFDRNHNTGGDDYSESTLVPATQTIYHDHLRPSRVILPVIP